MEHTTAHCKYQIWIYIDNTDLIVQNVVVLNLEDEIADADRQQ